jgi:hypothetical protein
MEREELGTDVVVRYAELFPELFIAPAKGEAPPRPLKAGRRPRD